MNTLAAMLACVQGQGETPGRTVIEEPVEDPVIAVSSRCEALGPSSITGFYEDNPSYTDEVEELLPSSTPEEQGLDSEVLGGAADELAGEPFAWSLLVLRHGHVVLEESFKGASQTQSDSIHSASKSMLGLLVGQAIEGGEMELDQPVDELLPELFEGLEPGKRDITVEHLLTMSSGLAWTEDETEYEIEDEEDWLAAYLALPQDHTPGEHFEYSTGSTHLLGAALAHATGWSLCDLAHERLLDPLGAEAEHWSRDPQGYFSGGYGVAMVPRELARFGQLALDGGSWEGQQIVSADWLEASHQWHQDAGWGHGYGYLWWLWRPGDHEFAVAWGYGGQLVYLLPEQDIVVVVTTNTRDYAPDYDAHDLVIEYVLAAVED